MPDRLHILPKHRTILESLLAEHLPDVEVWAYGSRVNGRSHDGSDLDLVLRGPDLEMIPENRLSEFQEAVRESRIPFLVEARDWARLPERFHTEVKRKYQVLVSNSTNVSANRPSASLGEWPSLTLRDAGVRLIDCVHKTPAAQQSGYPYVGIPQMKHGRVEFKSARKISTTDFVEWTKKAKPQRHDVILSRRTNPGVTATDETETEFALGQNLVLLRANGHRVKPAFLKWLVRSPAWWKQIDKFMNVGAVFSSLKCADVPNFELPIPPLKAQEKMCALLDALDKKIEFNRQMNETLEAMARAIFKDWFVDFGPTRANAEGRPPYLAPEFWNLFPDALDDQDKPVGWTLAPLSTLAQINPESWSKRNAPEEVVYVDLANTKHGSIEATQPFLWKDAPSRAKRILRPGDTIVGLVRPGNCSYAFISVPGLTGSTGFGVLRPRNPNDAAFVFLSATAPDNIERLTHLADGAAYPAVRPEAVETTEVAIADNAVTSSFSALVTPIIDRMERNKIENQTLSQSRDLLLPKLMSGEIRLTQAEKIVEEAI